MLEYVEESRTVRLAGDLDQYRTLTHKTRAILRRDKKRYDRSLGKDIEGHLHAYDLRPAY